MTEDTLVSDNGICSYHPGYGDKFYTTISCDSEMKGQWVQIKLRATTQLMVYEVDVHGRSLISLH